jgi:hypothetical protein
MSFPRKNFPQENSPAGFSGEKPPREIPKEFPGPNLGNLTDSTRNGAGTSQGYANDLRNISRSGKYDAKAGCGVFAALRNDKLARLTLEDPDDPC